MLSRFEAYSQRKTEAALAAPIPGFVTVTAPDDPAGFVSIGNDWSRRLFDGWFYRVADDAGRQCPALSLVFVESADGNTEADDPSTLGGGATDQHLVYEGLSRVDADAVLAGAAAAAGNEIVFSVWHPELVRLRLERGRTRHPAQVVITGRGDLPIETALLYNEPSLRVIVIATRAGAAALAPRVASRTWIDVIDAGAPLDVRFALGELQARGIDVVSAIGGRRTAATLLQAGVVSEIYLTTSPKMGGKPGTPLFDAGLPPHRVLLEKEGRAEERGVRFRHLVV